MHALKLHISLRFERLLNALLAVVGRRLSTVDRQHLTITL
jgi:hypothetical protein